MHRPAFVGSSGTEGVGTIGPQFMKPVKKLKNKIKKVNLITSFQRDFVKEFKNLKDSDGYDYFHRAMALQAMEALDFLRKSLFLQVMCSKKYRVYKPTKQEGKNG